MAIAILGLDGNSDGKGYGEHVDSRLIAILNYPAAPWNLRGYGWQTLQLMRCDRLQSFLPPGLDIVSVLPGYTVGGLYLARYEAGSTLEYSELMVVGGLVRQGLAIGAWITHIYVDSETSVAGGRGIWGLPKQLARFDWHGSGQAVTVWQENVRLCKLQSGGQFPLWQQTLPIPVLSQQQGTLWQFMGQAKADFKLARSSVIVPPTSPLACFDWSQPYLTVFCDSLMLQANEPQRL